MYFVDDLECLGDLERDGEVVVSFLDSESDSDSVDEYLLDLFFLDFLDFGLFDGDLDLFEPFLELLLKPDVDFDDELFGLIGDTVLDLDRSFIVLVDVEGGGVLTADGTVVHALCVLFVVVIDADGSDLRFS